MTAQQKKKINKILLTLQKAEARIRNLVSDINLASNYHPIPDDAETLEFLHLAFRALRTPVFNIMKAQEIEYLEKPINTAEQQ